MEFEGVENEFEGGIKNRLRLTIKINPSVQHGQSIRRPLISKEKIIDEDFDGE